MSLLGIDGTQPDPDPCFDVIEGVERHELDHGFTDHDCGVGDFNYECQCMNCGVLMEDNE